MMELLDEIRRWLEYSAGKKEVTSTNTNHDDKPLEKKRIPFSASPPI